jgi:BirA family biotin operon repressor/biotin-[acetyl-CoA-carboxylase] ligase
MIGKKKLGGVLVEMEGVPDGEINLVIGVGLNVNMVAGGPDDRAWISLRQVSGEMFDRNDLARKLISRITKGFEDCLHSDFRDCLDRWRCLDGLLGKALVVLNYSCKVTGTGIGVDDSGQYGLRDSAGNIHWFSSGEISLREAGDGISGY